MSSKIPVGSHDFCRSRLPIQLLVKFPSKVVTPAHLHPPDITTTSLIAGLFSGLV
jgi:hypothetical protein